LTGRVVRSTTLPSHAFGAERQLAPPSAWAILALASGDAAFRAHVAGRLSDPDRSRAKTRLAERGFPTLVSRLRGRADARSFEAGAAARLVDLLTDERLVLAGDWCWPERHSRPWLAVAPPQGDVISVGVGVGQATDHAVLPQTQPSRVARMVRRHGDEAVVAESVSNWGQDFR
jgi:hypothetical protein